MTPKQLENLEKARFTRWENAQEAKERREAQKEFSRMLNSFEDDFHRKAVAEYYDRMHEEAVWFDDDSDYNPYFGLDYEF